MKFDRYVDLILEAVNQKYLVLLPGGFKSPTLGHYSLIKSYSENPDVAKVVVLVGPKEREGITREHSLKTFELYGVNKFPKVTVEASKSDNPMQAAFDYLVDRDHGSDKKLIFGVGASNKGGDEERSFKFANYFSNHPDKLPEGIKVGIPPIIPAAQFGDTDISATTLRQAIKTKDVALIRKLIPPGVDVKKFLAIF